MKLNEIKLEPGVVITVENKKCNDYRFNRIDISIQRLKKNLVAVQPWQQLYHDIGKDWMLDDATLKSLNINVEDIVCVACYKRHLLDYEVLYARPEKVKMNIEEIEAKLGLEPGTLIIEDVEDPDKKESHYEDGPF